MPTTQTIDESVSGEPFLELSAATDKFEQYANPHAIRIARIGDAIARRLNMAAQDRRSLRRAALLHDLGEITMERNYISRAGTLTDEERIDLARHPVIGEHEARRSGADRAAQLLVRWHHEWWNGCGYPDALRGEEIPLAARIIRVADSYAALTDARPFRPALTQEQARREIIEMAGIEFDPRVATLFLSLEPIPELESFAAASESSGPESKGEWELFSSFIE